MAEPVGLTSESFSTLVEIQPEGTKTPIFCAPAADGFTRVYHELSDYLGNDQPVYGLDSPGIYGIELPDTLEEMAAGFVDEIRAVQPQGPYVLVGYCSGGTVALEIAQQLIKAGQTVAMLGLIETYNWLTAPSTHPTLRTKLSYEFQRIEFHIRNFLLLSLKEKRKFLGSKWKAVKTRTRVWRDSLKRKFSSKKRGAVSVASVNMADLWRKHDDLAEAYVPQPYPGRLIHFRPRRDYKCHLGEELTATQEVLYHRLSAYPAGVMVSPFVGELAHKLSKAIEEGLGERVVMTSDCELDVPKIAPGLVEA